MYKQDKEPSSDVPPKGHNRTQSFSDAERSKMLRSYIERIERLEEDKAGIASDIRDVFAESKSNGFDVKAMRQILKLRKMKANERTEAEYTLDRYKRALGMQIDMFEEGGSDT